MVGMFGWNFSLKVIYASNKWNMDKVTSKTDMFTSSGVTDVTKSDTCMEDANADLASLSLFTTKTSNSIKAIANAINADSGIRTYEYSIDGTNYVSSNDNVYTFYNLDSNKNYNVYARIVTNNGGKADSNKEVTTDSLSPATFEELNGMIKINYPIGLKELYKINGSEYMEGNMISGSGVARAKVTDGVNTRVKDGEA